MLVLSHIEVVPFFVREVFAISARAIVWISRFIDLGSGPKCLLVVLVELGKHLVVEVLLTGATTLDEADHSGLEADG